jgi:hypothetical protein
VNEAVKVTPPLLHAQRAGRDSKGRPMHASVSVCRRLSRTSSKACSGRQPHKRPDGSDAGVQPLPPRMPRNAVPHPLPQPLATRVASHLRRTCGEQQAPPKCGTQYMRTESYLCRTQSERQSCAGGRLPADTARVSTASVHRGKRCMLCGSAGRRGGTRGRAGWVRVLPAERLIHRWRAGTGARPSQEWRPRHPVARSDTKAASEPKRLATAVELVQDARWWWQREASCQRRTPAGCCPRRRLCSCSRCASRVLPGCPAKCSRCVEQREPRRQRTWAGHP